MSVCWFCDEAAHLCARIVGALFMKEVYFAENAGCCCETKKKELFYRRI